MFSHKIQDLPNLSTITKNGKRYYVTPEGNSYPSVTTILSSLQKPIGLTEWRDNIGHEKADRYTQVRANRGEAVHLLCERYVRNEENILRGAMPDVMGIFRNMKPYLNKISLIYSIEAQLYCDQYKFAGRCDVIGKYMEAPAIIDFKTNSMSVDETPEKIIHYALQLAAYSIAWKERTGEDIDWGVLIFGSNEHGARAFKMPLTKYKERFIMIAKEFNDGNH